LSPRTSARQRPTAPPSTPLLVKAFPVQPLYVSFYWDFVKDYLSASLEHATGEIELEDLRRWCEQGKLALWVAKHDKVCGAAICEIVQYTRKKRINILAIGGDDFDSWAKQAQEALEKWAQELGAEGIEARVRKGFAPKLEAIGFKQVYIGMVKDGTGIGK